MLRDFIRDLAHGARVLRRHPAFTAVVVTTLALAIGATVTVFSIVDAWLFRPLNFPQADRLVIAFAAKPETPAEPAVWLPYRAYLGWKARARSFTAISGAFVRDVTLTRETDAQTLLGLNVTPEFFQTLGVAPLFGRPLGEQDVTGAPAVVLSYGLWQRHFGGSRDVIGQPIALSNMQHAVVGVMPRDFETRVLDMRFEFWTPFRAGQPGYQPGGVGSVALIARLRDGVTIAAARSEVVSLTRELESAYPRNFNDYVTNLTSLQGDNARSVRATLLTISAAVASLLLIAAMNVGTLILGRGLVRLREAAIRAAIGCGRGRLVRQFLTESLLVASIGTAAGLALAAIATRLFIAWDPLGTLPANTIQVDWRVLTAAAAAMALTTIVCGLIPALRISLADPQDALRAGGERGASAAPAQRAQLVMLTAQIAACVVLLVATTLLTRTFLQLQAEPLGFEPRNLLIASVVMPNDALDSGEQRNVFYAALADRVRALPGVRAVAGATSLPLNSGAPSTVYVGADDPPNAPRISTQEVTAEFFATLEIPLIAGRGFDTRDRAGSAPVLIVNTRAAQQLFGGPAAAIGRRVRLNQESWREIVGVVGGVRSTFFNTLEWTNDPIVYRPAAQGFNRPPNPTVTSFGFKLHVRIDRPLTIADLRQAVASVKARVFVTELRTATEMISVATRQPAFRMTLLLGFAAVSLLLAAIGIYGVVAQSVTQRLREVAIRLALGADPRALAGTVMRRAIVAAVAGVVLGGVAAVMLSKTLEALLYGVRPRDAISLAAAAVGLMLVTAIAAFLPARRATRVDPASILRGD